MRCVVMWCGVTWCHVMRRRVMWCHVMRCCVMCCDEMWRDVTWFGVTWCHVMLCVVMWCVVIWCDVPIVTHVSTERVHVRYATLKFGNSTDSRHWPNSSHAADSSVSSQITRVVQISATNCFSAVGNRCVPTIPRLPLHNRRCCHNSQYASSHRTVNVIYRWWCVERHPHYLMTTWQRSHRDNCAISSSNVLLPTLGPANTMDQS